MYDFIGYTAIFLASVSLLPQMYQMIVTKEVKDLNIFFLLIVLLADILYFTYGFINNDNILYLSTIPPSISNIIVIFLWLYYQNYLCCKYKKIKNIENKKDTIIII